MIFLCSEFSYRYKSFVFCRTDQWTEESLTSFHFSMLNELNLILCYLFSRCLLSLFWNSNSDFTFSVALVSSNNLYEYLIRKVQILLKHKGFQVLTSKTRTFTWLFFPSKAGKPIKVCRNSVKVRKKPTICTESSSRSATFDTNNFWRFCLNTVVNKHGERHRAWRRLAYHSVGYLWFGRSSVRLGNAPFANVAWYLGHSTRTEEENRPRLVDNFPRSSPVATCHVRWISGGDVVDLGFRCCSSGPFCADIFFVPGDRFLSSRWRRFQ